MIIHRHETKSELTISSAIQLIVRSKIQKVALSSFFYLVYFELSIENFIILKHQ